MKNPITKELKRRGYSLVGYATVHNLSYESLRQVIGGKVRSSRVETQLKRDGLYDLIEWKIQRTDAGEGKEENEIRG